MLDKHEFELTSDREPVLKIFNNVETFLRCFDIFKRQYEQQTGNTIKSDISFSMVHTPLETFCKEYVQQHPELAKLSADELEKFIRLLAVFNVGDDIVDLSVTIKMSVIRGTTSQQKSFKPVDVVIDSSSSSKEKISSNEISLGQQNLSQQIQNLSGSELSMPYIKDADGRAQLEALKTIVGRKKINMVDVGGGRGETNAVPKAIQDLGTAVRLLNVEPYAPFAKPYIDAHRAVGIKDVRVLQRSAQDVSAADVMTAFGGEKADVIFASHSFYFLLGDMYKFSQEYAHGGKRQSLTQHPLWKFFDMLADNGVLIVTLQTGAGARLFRNALLGKHGLDKPSAAVVDETIPLLSSFGNLATFLRYFELFAKLYEEQTGKKINTKMHYSVANVPLDDFTIVRDPKTGGYSIRNPKGEDSNPLWLAPKMMDFYGNWKELQTLATLTPEKAEKMSPEELKNLGLKDASKEAISERQKAAVKTQDVFLHILRIFAPEKKNMQHPNITLEITVQP